MILYMYIHISYIYIYTCVYIYVTSPTLPPRNVGFVRDSPTPLEHQPYSNEGVV